MTGASVLAVGGIVSAAVSFIGGLLALPWVIGCGAGIMLVTNVLALIVEHCQRRRAALGRTK